MTITFTNTRRDLLAFQVYHLGRSPLLLLVNGACLTFMACLFFHGAGGVPLAPRIVATVFFLLLFLPILLAVQVALLALSVVLRQVGNLIEETVTLSDAGVQVKTATSCQDHQWAGIKKVCRTRRHLFIYLTPSIACVVPRRAFASAEEWEAFNDFCRRKTTDPNQVQQNQNGDNPIPETDRL